MATNDNEIYNKENLELLGEYLKPKNNTDIIKENIDNRINDLIRIIGEIITKEDYSTQPGK